MKKWLPSIWCIIFISGCQKDTHHEAQHFFRDGFEDYTTFRDLFSESKQRWSIAEITHPDNEITLDSAKARTGKKSIKFTASPSTNGVVSKASIAKQNMSFIEGETVRLSASLFLESMLPVSGLFIMDIEEHTAIGAMPGMRLMIVDDYLRVEYKTGDKDISQPEGRKIAFPRNQWVNITWELKLSRVRKGTVRLWQNGELIIESMNIQTLPKDLLYFQQGTKGIYNSCEAGITANSTRQKLTLWADDVIFEKIN